MELLQRDRQPEGDAGDSGDEQNEAGENENSAAVQNMDPQNQSDFDSDDDFEAPHLGPMGDEDDAEEENPVEGENAERDAEEENPVEGENAERIIPGFRIHLNPMRPHVHPALQIVAGRGINLLAQRGLALVPYPQPVVSIDQLNFERMFKRQLLTATTAGINGNIVHEIITKDDYEKTHTGQLKLRFAGVGSVEIHSKDIAEENLKKHLYKVALYWASHQNDLKNHFRFPY